jgi:hypothetical protein
MQIFQYWELHKRLFHESMADWSVMKYCDLNYFIWKVLLSVFLQESELTVWMDTSNTDFPLTVASSLDSVLYVWQVSCLNPNIIINEDKKHQSSLFSQKYWTHQLASLEVLNSCKEHPFESVPCPVAVSFGCVWHPVVWSLCSHLHSTSVCCHTYQLSQ